MQKRFILFLALSAAILTALMVATACPCQDAVRAPAPIAVMPPGVPIVDAALESLRIQPNRIRKPQRDEPAVDERVHAVVEIAG